MKTATLILTAFFLAGCAGTHDLIKDAEGKAYDRLAGAFSKYCEGKTEEGVLGALARQEALEARREIRQRGIGGPHGPMDKVPDLDDKTAYGTGPVIRVYCGGEKVPEAVWQDFIRIK